MLILRAAVVQPELAQLGVEVVVHERAVVQRVDAVVQHALARGDRAVRLVVALRLDVRRLGRLGDDVGMAVDGLGVLGRPACVAVSGQD